MRKILLLTLLMCSLTYNVYAGDDFTYDFDYENGTYGATVVDEAEADMGIHNADKGYFDNAQANGGTYSARFDFDSADADGWETKASIDIGNKAISNGDELFLHIEAYWDAAMTWTPGVIPSSGEVKFFRVSKYQDDDPNVDAGGCTMMMVAVADTVRIDISVGSIVQDETDSPAYHWRHSDTFATMSDNSWHTIDAYFLMQDTATGIVSLTIDGINKTHTGVHTMVPGTTGYKNCYLFSQWNGGTPVGGGSVFLDNAYLSTEQPYNQVPAPDSTAPDVSSLSPDENDTGISLTTDPIISFYANDAGNGVDSATIGLIVEGNDESGDLTITGTSSSYYCILDLSYLDSPLTNGQQVDVNITADDLTTANSLSTSYFFTMTDATVSGTVFATGNPGDTSNYTELNSGRWELYDDAGDNVYRVNTTEYSSSGNGDLGEFSIYGTKYTAVDMTAEIQCNETLGENANADYAVIIGYISSDDYVTINLNQSSGSNAILHYEDGASTTLDTAGESLISDNSFHTIRVKSENGTITVWVDGTQKMQSTTYLPPNGNIGFGSYNDKFSIDDVVITNLGGAQASAVPPFVKPGGTVSKWANSQS